MSVQPPLRGNLSDMVGMVRPRVERSVAASDEFFAREAEAIVRCAAAMADRFFHGGRLLVFAGSANAADAQHNAVEYVHPVIAGCRALPALSLGSDAGVLLAGLLGAEPTSVFSRQLELLGRPSDIALAFDQAAPTPLIERGLQTAAARGLLTVALLTGGTAASGIADHQFAVASTDPGVAEEVHLATYHILWELVHVILNHRGIRLDDTPQGATHDR